MDYFYILVYVRDTEELETYTWAHTVFPVAQLEQWIRTVFENLNEHGGGNYTEEDIQDAIAKRHWYLADGDEYEVKYVGVETIDKHGETE